jgi:hypothetical protein
MVMDEDKVGYGKPPKHSRFVKGRSGNPKGRPKEAKNLKTEISKALREKVTIREGERTKKVTKLYALVQSIFAKPFKGDSRAAISALNTIARFIDPNHDLNAEHLNFDYGPSGKVKELTQEEKFAYIRKFYEASKEVKGLPPAARKAMFGDENGAESEVVDTANRG